MNVSETQAETTTVGSGAACIPDLETTHVSLIGIYPGSATGAIPGNIDANQVRQGAVPAPPNAHLVTRGSIAFPSGGAGAVSQIDSVIGHPTIEVYQTDCYPNDIRAFYVAVLLQNQWTGGFTPASGAMMQGGSSSRRGRPSGQDVTLFDLDAMTTGRFVNVHPGGDSTAFIQVVAAVEAPGTPVERHPTYVQILLQRSAGSSQTRPQPPTVHTTPNVGASGGPPPSSPR